MSYYWILCLGICLVESSTQGALYEAKLEFSPNPFKPLVDETLVVLCRLEKKVSTEARQFQRVNSITIKKGKIEVAKLTSDKMEVEVDNDFSGATGSGKLDIGGTVYMQVDVRNPKKTLKGSYTCEVEGDDDNGDSVTATNAYRVDSVDPSLSEIIEKLQKAEEDIEDSKKEIEDLKTKNVELTKQIEDNDEDIEELNTYKSTKVSFSAVRDNGQSSWYEKVSAGTDIVFNIAVVNIGGGYNTNTGVFTCPVAGSYYIRFDLQVLDRSDGKTFSGVHLLHNGGRVTLSWIYDGDTASGARGVIGNGRVLQLNKGDTLKLRTYWDSRFYWKYNYGYTSTFSGYLLK